MGVSLAAAEYGAGRPVAILHGLFGSGRNWATIAQRLAAHRRVVALDLRNHGASAWADTMSYREMADDVFAALDKLGERRFALIGHSMGGKVAMTMALERGERIERLVVVDIAPALYPPAYLGYVRAMRGLDLSRIQRRAEADARLADAVPDPVERAFLLQNLVFASADSAAQGAPAARWRLNLAAIERALPELAGFPAPAIGAAYPGPSLFVRGDASNHLRRGHEPTIRRLFPNARFAGIAGAGHWPHFERPQAFLDLVAPFLAAGD